MLKWAKFPINLIGNNSVIGSHRDCETVTRWCDDRMASLTCTSTKPSPIFIASFNPQSPPADKQISEMFIKRMSRIRWKMSASFLWPWSASQTKWWRKLIWKKWQLCRCWIHSEASAHANWRVLNIKKHEVCFIWNKHENSKMQAFYVTRLVTINSEIKM